MDLFLAILGGVGGLAVSLASGLFLGRKVRNKPHWFYWGLNALVFVVGVAISIIGLAFGQFWLSTFAMTFIGGGLTGLKYGLGESLGLWGVHDRAFGIDSDTDT